MRCDYSCGSDEHLLHRRKFLGAAAAGLGGVVAGLGAFARPALAGALDSTQRRVLVFNMHGGLSQLESWDPKPGTVTGGPFRSIPTSVPGVHISELLPMTARQMHRLTIARGVNTAEDDHGKGAYLMTTGRRSTPAANYPVVGAVMAKSLAPDDSPLPGHIVISPGGGGGRSNDSAYLGPKYASVVLGNGQPPQYSARSATADVAALADRDALRHRADDRFTCRRRTAQTDAFTYSYDQALQLMERRQVFDVTKEPVKDQDRYGRSDFGRHCLLARRLLNQGISFVQVSHANYDTHNENFDFHLQQVGEFDRPFACLVEDLADSGMLDGTLIVVMSEFGRTPNINLLYGRDHWSKAWSVVLGGARIPRGFVYGKTDPKGTSVVDGQIDAANLFHTYLQAVGITSTDTVLVDGREMPIADPASGARQGTADMTGLDVKQTHVAKTLAHDAPLISGRFDPSGKFVFASSQDRSVVRWRLDKEAKTAFVGHESWVFAIGFCDAGQTLLTGGGDGRLIWWNTADEKPVAKRTVAAHDGWARCIAVSPDGQFIATGGNDNLVKLWTAADGKPVRTLTGHANRVYSVVFHPDGQHLISGDLFGSVRVWEPATGKEVATLDAQELHTYERGQRVDFGGIRGLAVSPDRTQVACGGLYKASNPLGAVHEPLVVLFDWASKKKLHTQIAPGIPGGGLWRLRFLPDQTLVGVSGGTSGGFLLFWNLDQDKDFHRFGLPDIVRDVDLHPTDPLAATVHHDGKVRLCRMAAPVKS